MTQTKKRNTLQLLCLAVVSIAFIFPGCSVSSSASEEQIRSLQSEVNSLKTDINSLKNDVSDLESKNSVLESKLKTVENNVNSLGYKVKP